MKNIVLILVMLFTFGMNVNAQDVASSDNDFVVLDNTTNYDGNTETSEVTKLKADLMKITKDAFRDAKVKVPSDLEIILINKSSSITRWIVTYKKNSKKKLVLGELHGDKLQMIKPINYIEKKDEDPYFLVYRKQ